MTFAPLDDRFIQRLEHPLDFTATPAPVASPPAISPAGNFLSDVPDTPLTWLWPGRIPLGHLTLLDAAPGSDPSLLALNLAACISSGKPLPGSTPVQPRHVILYAPYDSASATLKPRLQAAGGDPGRVLLFQPPIADPSRTGASQAHPLKLPGDLEHLSNIIRCLEAPIVILDPATAISGLTRHLLALSNLARQTSCAILLIRSLHQTPADILRSSGPASPLQEAIRSRLLLTPDPADERHHLLITTRHPLCSQPPILSYDLLYSEAGIPTFHFLAERDRAQLLRLSTGPLRSPHRQAILHFLQHSDSPQNIPSILEATSYDDDAGRQMLIRMKMAGELVSPARGLYTTTNHPSLASFPHTNAPLSVSHIPTLLHTTSPSIPEFQDTPPSQNPTTTNSPQPEIPSTPSIPCSQPLTPLPPESSPVTNVTNPTATTSPLPSPHPPPPLTG